jgi:hypothetical protein
MPLVYCPAHFIVSLAFVYFVARVNNGHKSTAMALPVQLSLASTVIGFISFTFTLLIWLQASWHAFLTLGSAPSQVRDSFSTLRQGLYEEREYLKWKRRQKGGSEKGLYYEGGPAKIMNDAIKDLIRNFKKLEHPFLITPHSGREKDLEWSFDATQHQYNCDLAHRILWLRIKNDVESIAVKLQRIQTRRIESMVEDQLQIMRDTMGMVRDCEHRLGEIEHRLQMSQIG